LAALSDLKRFRDPLVTLSLTAAAQAKEAEELVAFRGESVGICLHQHVGAF
jgi:hypothetical protein